MAQLGVVERSLPLNQPPDEPPPTHCLPITLPSGGTVVISPQETITLIAEAIYTPLCTPNSDSPLDGSDIAIADVKDPFHASITPQSYATGAATVVAWMLVVMLIITPRTFFLGGTSGRSGLMGRRGMISGATGGASVIGVGTRPWLQKVAALTVAVSMTVATADTFKVAARQYAQGVINAEEVRSAVVSSTELKVSRVFSDVFIWLAQVQTLIRLFPRHKEKVLIKWIGFALILFDITFSCLNNFGPDRDTRRPMQFTTAIPALNYLFQLSLSMLYAAWVIYYAITKRRYAFVHDMMWNITVVALLSIIAIVTPIVFFIIDICNPSIAGWGDYFRWVGAAAASVIVWEWVERIEALEREERKDGILGREIYDGDEMLDTTPSHDFWPRKRQGSSSTDDEKKGGDWSYYGGTGGGYTTSTGFGFTEMSHRIAGFRRQRRKTNSPHIERSISVPAPAPTRQRPEPGRPDPQHMANVDRRNGPPPPVPVVTSPVSRADTTSADSTVYTIRYHSVSDSPTKADPLLPPENQSGSGLMDSTSLPQQHPPPPKTQAASEPAVKEPQARTPWSIQVANLFRRSGRSPPPEVQRGRVIEPLGIDQVSASIPPRNYAGLALRDRLGTFAAHQGERFRSKRNSTSIEDSNLPVTIVPAHPRGRTWSPEQLASLRQEQSGLQSESQENMRITPVVTSERTAPPPVVLGTEEPSNASTTPLSESQESCPMSRNPRIRFAPAPTVSRGSDATGSRTPPQPQNLAALGREVTQAPEAPEASSAGHSDVPSVQNATLEETSTRTDHDR